MNRLGYDNIFELATDDPVEAADLQFRADLMLTLREIFRDRGWKQAQISEALGIAQPRVSELMHGKIDLFSSDKLIGFLARLNIWLRPSLSAERKVVCDVVQAA